MHNGLSKPRVLIIYILLFIPFALAAGPFRQLNMEDGLSSRRIYRLEKDSSGFVWILNHIGIDRYDGNEVRHYSLEKFTGTKEQTFSAILVRDAAGTVWLSLKSGRLYAYDKQKDDFVLRFTLTDHVDGYPALNDIMFDNKNRLWLCTAAGLYLYEQEENVLSVLPGLSSEHITRIIQTDDFTLIAGTDTRLYKIREGNNKKSFFTLEKIALPVEARTESLHAHNNRLYTGTFSHGVYLVDLESGHTSPLAFPIPGVPVRSISSAANKVFIGTDGAGLYCFDNTNQKLIKHYTAEEDENNGLSGNTVSDVLIDERNCIWVSTSTNGISVLDPQYPEINWIKHGYMNPNSLLSNHVNVIMEDSDGDVWYGTNNGVSLYRHKEKKWTHYLNERKQDDSHSSVILTLCREPSGSTLAGGFGTGVYRINKQTNKIEQLPTRTASGNEGISTDYIYSIYADDAHVWFAGIEGDLTRYSYSSRSYQYYPINCMGDIKEGNNNTLLIAGCTGLMVLDKSTGNITQHNTFNDIPLIHPIRCLLQSHIGEIWMATDGQGLIRFSPHTGQSRFYTLENGINSNSVNSLQQDGKGNIWFSTEKNMYRFDIQTNMITDMNGLLGIEWGHFNPNASAFKHSGNLVFGTAQGAIEFSPHFETVEPDSVKLIFTDFSLLYKSIQAGGEGSPLEKAINETNSVKLKYEQNSFSISFSAINFTRSQNITYEYRLAEYEKAWTESAPSDKIDYMYLKPGKYHFHIKATNRNTGHVLGERTIAISIGNPFWLSPWAFVVYIIILLFVVFLIYQHVVNRVNEHNIKEKIRSFISIAHDIRTPVTLIKAPLSELQTQENLSDRGRKSLSLAMENADKLFGMVTQLLDLQKLELQAGKNNITLQNIHTYMQGRIAPFRLAASQKRIEIVLEIPSSLSDLWFDQNKLDKIIDNLLSNAIKYTEEGTITISVAASENKWCIEVQDTGIGIPASDQKNLFKEFFRAGNAIESNQTGTGIGLLLSKKLARSLNGDITFTSEQNKGSCFTLTLPIQQKPDKTEIKEEVIPQQPENLVEQPHKKEVLLLAEDHPDIREYLTDSLSQEYEVISVTDGKEALKTAREINPDIIISDILMPGLRGDDLCRIMKSSVETSHIPIILLTALNEKENIIQGLEAGASDYITKPFDYAVLKARIRNILQNREQLRKNVLSPDAPAETINYASELDKEFLEKAIKLIETEMEDPEFSINEFCRAMGMSRTSVYNKIKTLTDQAPNDFIRIIRLNRAKNMLLTRQYSISEVSNKVGFADPKYFSTCFKKQFGISPSKV